MPVSNAYGRAFVRFWLENGRIEFDEPLQNKNLAVMSKINLDLLLFRPIFPFQVVMFFVYNNDKYRFEFHVLFALTGKWVKRIRWNFAQSWITNPWVPKANFYFDFCSPLFKVAAFVVCHYHLNPLILPWRLRSENNFKIK